ncbi:MAG TPA: MDR family MFS transporter [Gaiellaceae bacterium]|nr:MDR family MFS transporter [Gaiellaceae bacterium]
MNDRSVYPLGKRRTLVVFAGLMLGMLVAALNQTIVATAAPELVADLGGFDRYSWLFSAYVLAMTVTVPLYGKLSDLYGRRPFFVLGILLFATGSVLSGLAPSFEFLIAGRAVQGLGAGGLIPLAIAVIGDIVPPRRRGRWQALTSGVFAVSSVLGPTTGGWIADNASWRWAFFVSLPVAAVALVVVWFGFGRRERGGRRSVDALGAVLLAAATATGLYAAASGGVSAPWASPLVVGLFVASGALAVVFVAWERRVDEPILPLALFRERTIASVQIALFTVGAAAFGTIMIVPLFVQRVLGETATHSGAVLTPLMLGWISASVLSGQIVSHTGRYRPVLLAGPPVMGAGFLLLAGMGVGTTAAEMVRNVFVVGFGVGLVMQTFIVVVQNAVPRGMMGVATASAQFSRMVGATVGVTVMGAIMTARLGGESARAAGAAELAGAIHPAFLVGLGLAATAFLATLFLPHRELRDRMDADPAPQAA